jgi:SAM-dependent methyltransferase
MQASDLNSVGPLVDLVVRSAADAKDNLGKTLFMQKELKMMSALRSRFDVMTNDGYLEIPGDDGRKEIHEWGIWLLQNLPQRGSLFATSVVSTGFWENQHGSDYHRLNINAAKERKCEITRIFIIEDGDAFSAARARNIIEEQLKAGIVVKYIFDSELSDEYPKDFGIWNDQLVCYNEAKGNRYYTSDAELKRAREMRQKIMHDSRAYQPGEIIFPREHPMFLSADKLADQELRQKRPCAWYHGAWGYLRSLGLVENPRVHEEFFVKYLRRQFQTSSPQGLAILICGLADHEMFAVVEEAIESDQRDDVRDKHRVTVLDPCPAPLKMVQWYFTDYLGPNAKQTRFVRTRSRTRPAPTIREGRAENSGFQAASFDLIVTDCLVTKLPPGDQATVVREWHRLLRPDGYVVTTLRVGHGADGPPLLVRAKESEVRDYAERARRAFALLTHDELPIDAEKIVALATEYARRNESYPIPNDAGIRSLFAGFSIEDSQEVSVSPEYGELKNVRVFARRS